VATNTQRRRSRRVERNRSPGFYDALQASIVAGGVSITGVLGQHGADGLLSIAREAALELTSLSADERTLALTAAEIGVLVGIAIGLVAQQRGGRIVEPVATVH
jgi:hypothetical protein